MTLDDLDFLFGDIAKHCGITTFVVIGSLSIMGANVQSVPAGMSMSNDVDSYPEQNPSRAGDLVVLWGENSQFAAENGFYFDPASPKLATLPEAWEDRMIVRVLKSGVTIKFLEPNDCAVSKYARGAPNDRRWIRAGLQASILSLATIEYRMRETSFLDDAETSRARKLLGEDKAWLEETLAPPRA